MRTAKGSRPLRPLQELKGCLLICFHHMFCASSWRLFVYIQYRPASSLLVAYLRLVFAARPIPLHRALRTFFSFSSFLFGILFGSQEPVTNAGSLLTLQGAGAYDAAVHCASVSAARRISTGTPLAQAPIWPISGGSTGASAAGSSSAGGASGRTSTGGGGGSTGGAGHLTAGGSKSRAMASLGRRLRNAMMELFGGGSSSTQHSTGGASGSAGQSASREFRG